MKKKEEKNSILNNTNAILNNTIKICLIIFILYGLYYANISESFSNSISLLAVSEDQKGNLIGGSIIELNLKIIPGTGETFINLNTIEEIDTQISIINSQKIACDLFELDCENYDFYYDFEGSALVLKGPSASSAIAILTAKTINRISLNKNTVITGALNSGGLVGTVGGIETKIKVAEDNKFKKVLIPINSEYDILNNQTKIKVIKVMDIIDAHNEFNGPTYTLKTHQINSTNYKTLMKTLGEEMCERVDELNLKINFSNIKENSTEEIYLKAAEKSFNSSQIAHSIGNFYSMGSFCYNSNINNRILLEIQNNLTEKQRDEKLQEMKKEIDLKYVILNSKEYKKNITTINDLYVYLLLEDRLEEAKEFIKEAQKIKENPIKTIISKLPKFPENNSNITSNQTNNSTNTTTVDISQTTKVSKGLESDNFLKNNFQKDLLYSYAIERYYTVTLWETFINHNGAKIKFSDNTMNEACHKINKEIVMKSELMKNYGLRFFDKDIEEQSIFNNPLTNKFLCVYKGLELSARINTILTSIGIEENKTEEHTKNLMDFTTTRISLNSNGEFPLIPYIYYEYSGDLFNQQDYQSSLLYSNYALTYADLNLYLEKENTIKPKTKNTFKEVFQNVWFIGGLLVILGFLGQ